MKEKVLNLPESYNFKLLGISSKLSMHKLSWQLNELLGFDFRRLDGQEENENKSFSVYQYETKSALFSLIENKNNEGLLIKNFANIDYFLKIEGEISDKELQSLIKKIRQASDVYACLTIEVSALKKKDLKLLS